MIGLFFLLKGPVFKLPLRRTPPCVFFTGFLQAFFSGSSVSRFVDHPERVAYSDSVVTSFEHFRNTAEFGENPLFLVFRTFPPARSARLLPQENRDLPF